MVQRVHRVGQGGPTADLNFGQHRNFGTRVDI